MDHRSNVFFKILVGIAFSAFSFVIIYFAGLLIACFMDAAPSLICTILSALLLIALIAAIIIFKPKHKFILFILSVLVCAAPSITIGLRFGDHSYENGYMNTDSSIFMDNGECYDCFGRYRQKTITRNGKTYYYDFRRECYFYPDYHHVKVYCEEIYDSEY